MDNTTSMSREQMLAYRKERAPIALVEEFESLQTMLEGVGINLKRNSAAMFDPAIADMVVNTAMQIMDTALESAGYDDNETQVMEAFDVSDDRMGTVFRTVSVADAHRENMQQLLENSMGEARTVANQFNLNQLTPFDGFLPFTIVRSYLPLIGKDIMPTQTPPMPFVRIKQEYKYIVTKTGERYLRPDIYSDIENGMKVLNSAKGRRVTDEWYPLGTEVAESDSTTVPDITTEDGKKYVLPNTCNIENLDILAESGGLQNVGDDLDINICVNGIRAIVTNAAGQSMVVEQTGFEAYPDLTSISPQRSIAFTVKLPVKNDAGEVESYVYDKVFGDYNAYTKTINLVSLRGYVRQVQFDGNLSNKNNTEYLSFTSEFGVTQHSIPEGINSNVPITQEDLQLYNETQSTDLVAYSINEMNEIFTNLEDIEIIGKMDKEYKRWEGVDEHNFEHMKGKVVFTTTVDLSGTGRTLGLKRNEYVQDEINYKIGSFIATMRNTLANEPFRLVAMAHPNIARLFVGNNVDWKITPGTQGIDGIRSDYRMGIYTSGGDSFKLVSSQKIQESDGIRFLLFPVNEQNFLSWKHFKHSMFFSRDYHHPAMQLVPNVRGTSRFYTHSYTPLQAKMFIVNYE